MSKFSLISSFAACALLLTGCIANDLPYPRQQEDILAIAVEGETSPAEIDKQELTVKIFLDEKTNPYKIKFTEFEISEGATSSADLLDGTYDLSRPMIIDLHRWQTYQWVISAEQNIEYLFSIAGQVGDSEIDIPGKRIVVRVPENMDLKHLDVTAFKLGPADITTYSPAALLGEHDFSEPVDIKVSYWGRTEAWTIYVMKTKQIVTTQSVDAWSRVIWAYASAPEDAENGFEYRMADGEWQRVPNEWITHNGGSFSARIIHLEPLTEYTVRAFSDDNKGNEITVKTDATADIVDGNFNQWWLNGKIWCPWDEHGVRYWDTGNTGAATLGQSNVQPSDYTPTGMGQSAKLETRFVGFGALGKLATGSIYTGSFKKIDGTNGILDFGRPFNLRPTKLKGYYQYTSAPINYADADHKYLLERPDSCHIYVALTNWDGSYEIRTNPRNRQLFDPNASYVIAYGELVVGDSFEGYKEFEIELKYRTTSEVPTCLQITCAASKYGDFFTGGAGSLLYVDELSWGWDY